MEYASSPELEAEEDGYEESQGESEEDAHRG
jgi:hypothetical protein